ncbi:GlxA family transcriptional regulator [Paracidovorax valerianellae]|uniref:Transcriptional regulator, AraC family with amidase-like domain n=1 Tax=Paracidovorax valerianellae TaxID=187868 RepID=A0A1G6YCQ8_9BURK|nr:helix-turn-helix domain-containing protein [Paracidovorax valerianellae]MDA8445795.1 helix-turn-helix domain-containing protein [Paracidovorax valerianellae]SDD88061.1 transcriptional regulator, AraC family with amidase-like domain [Paracidovorax valerianellae]
MPVPHSVDIVVYPGFKALEAVGPMSVFDYANVHLARRGQPAGYAVSVAAQALGDVPSDTAMSLRATRQLGQGADPHIALIVGSRDIETALASSPGIVAWAAQTAPRVRHMVALCSGSFFLGAAGLLDGARAATHWSVADLLQRRFPAVQVDADAIYVRSGNLWTSAGVTAGMDLALALVEEDFGRTLALEVARDLVMYLKRPGGQSQFSMHLASQGTRHPGIREVQAWILSHLAEPLPLQELASRAAMSERNFRRVFLHESGQSPSDFIETARLEGARRLLEEENGLPLKTVAARVGFRSDEPLRRLFLRRLGVTPQAYRERFGGPG